MRQPWKSRCAFIIILILLPIGIISGCKPSASAVYDCPAPSSVQQAEGPTLAETEAVSETDFRENGYISIIAKDRPFSILLESGDTVEFDGAQFLKGETYITVKDVSTGTVPDIWFYLYSTGPLVIQSKTQYDYDFCVRQELASVTFAGEGNAELVFDRDFWSASGAPGEYEFRYGFWAGKEKEHLIVNGTSDGTLTVTADGEDLLIAGLTGTIHVNTRHTKEDVCYFAEAGETVRIRFRNASLSVVSEPKH